MRSMVEGQSPRLLRYPARSSDLRAFYPSTTLRGPPSQSLAMGRQGDSLQQRVEAANLVIRAGKVHYGYIGRS